MVKKFLLFLSFKKIDPNLYDNIYQDLSNDLKIISASRNVISRNVIFFMAFSEIFGIENQCQFSLVSHFSTVIHWHILKMSNSTGNCFVSQSLLLSK